MSCVVTAHTQEPYPYLPGRVIDGGFIQVGVQDDDAVASLHGTLDVGHLGACVDVFVDDQLA